MNASYLKRLHEQMDAKLMEIGLSNAKPIDRAEKSISVIKDFIEKIHEHVETYHFKNQSEEILFYKEIKPSFMSMLVYYVQVFNSLNDRPVLTNRRKEQAYWKKKEYEIDRWFENHQFLMAYYVSGSDWMDAHLFVRKPKNRFYLFGLPKELDPVAFYGDPNFSTSHDFQMAEVMAHLKLYDFVRQQQDEAAKIDDGPPQIREFKGAEGFIQVILRYKGELNKKFDWKMSPWNEIIEQMIGVLHPNNSPAEVEAAVDELYEASAFECQEIEYDNEEEIEEEKDNDDDELEDEDEEDEENDDGGEDRNGDSKESIGSYEHPGADRPDDYVKLRDWDEENGVH